MHSKFAALLLLPALAACGVDPTNGGVPDVSGIAPIVPGYTSSRGDEFRVEIGDRVFFAYDQSELSKDAQATLGRQAAWLKQRPQLQVVIEGHADERGTREYNLALGERRAAVVHDYLVALGVPASRLSSVSYGAERPAVIGSNVAAWGQSRRTVTVPQVQ